MPKKKIKTIKKVSNFERIPSGIPGLDRLMEGGFLKGSSVLISGGAGTGKTIFCLQYIWEGLERGETCMFITLEEKTGDLIDDVARFGWDLRKYIQSKKLFLEYQDPFQLTDITAPIIEKIKEHKVSRVAVDSTGVFGMYYKDPFEVRKQLFKLISGLKESGVTSLLTTELPEDSKTLARFGVEEFIVDGVIKLEFLGLGKSSFNLQVRKMRRTNHKKDIYPFDITKNGLIVRQIE